ncbi:ABC transporter substrate-binding protein [Alcaligenaceae bacterium]|nr:ABC transporter substrate-binding protein [Alcaligenaceae bacterium]
MRLNVIMAGLLTIMGTGAALAATPGISDDVIKIGVMTDLSGPYSATGGRGSVVATEMAVAEFGGEINGKKIEIITADHQGKPDIAAGTARKWLDVDHVDVITEINNSAVALSIYNLAKEKNALVLATGPASDALTYTSCIPTGIHYTYDTFAFANSSVNGLAQTGKKDWFMIAADYAFGKAGEEATRAALAKVGGKVVDGLKFPLNTTDFSSFILSAQSSNASIIGLVSAGADTVNAIKAAKEFGVTQIVAPQFLFIQDVHALGLETAQGVVFGTAFYWDRTAETRKWSEEFYKRMNQTSMPSQEHAGQYSAVYQYLKSIKALGTDDARAIVADWRGKPINDMFAQNGHLREDGRFVHDMYVAKVKSPAESKAPWDYYDIIATVPGDQAFRPMDQGKCDLKAQALGK